MAWTHYSAIIPYPLLSFTSQYLSYVIRSTILSVRQHLEEGHRKLHLDITYVQHLLCEDDVSIMDLVNTKPYTKWILTKKKRSIVFRMFLGVQYVTQISTVDEINFVP